MKITTTAILLVALLAGCMSQEELIRKDLTAQGMPLTYIDGYADGCSSGRAPLNIYHSFRKDPVRFGRDEMYRQGWNDGLTYCKADEERLDRIVNGRR